MHNTLKYNINFYTESIIINIYRDNKRKLWNCNFLLIAITNKNQILNSKVITWKNSLVDIRLIIGLVNNQQSFSIVSYLLIKIHIL